MDLKDKVQIALNCLNWKLSKPWICVSLRDTSLHDHKQDKVLVWFICLSLAFFFFLHCPIVRHVLIVCPVWCHRVYSLIIRPSPCKWIRSLIRGLTGWCLSIIRVLKIIFFIGFIPITRFLKGLDRLYKCMSVGINLLN